MLVSRNYFNISFSYWSGWITWNCIQTSQSQSVNLGSRTKQKFQIQKQLKTSFTKDHDRLMHESIATLSAYDLTLYMHWIKTVDILLLCTSNGSWIAVNLQEWTDELTHIHKGSCCTYYMIALSIHTNHYLSTDLISMMEWRIFCQIVLRLLWIQ